MNLRIKIQSWLFPLPFYHTELPATIALPLFESCETPFQTYVGDLSISKAHDDKIQVKINFYEIKWKTTLKSTLNIESKTKPLKRGIVMGRCNATHDFGGHDQTSRNMLLCMLSSLRNVARLSFADEQNLQGAGNNTLITSFVLQINIVR